MVALSEGTIISDVGSAITALVVFWSTNPDPKITDSKTTDNTGAWRFTSELTGLTPATSYYVRANATNVVTTKYGPFISFNTLGQTPLATTLPATNITSTGANLNDTVNANQLNTIVTFEYGTTIAYGNTITTTQSPVSGNTNTNVSAEISDLSTRT